MTLKTNEKSKIISLPHLLILFLNNRRPKLNDRTMLTHKMPQIDPMGVWRCLLDLTTINYHPELELNWEDFIRKKNNFAVKLELLNNFNFVVNVFIEKPKEKNLHFVAKLRKNKNIAQKHKLKNLLNWLTISLLNSIEKNKFFHSQYMILNCKNTFSKNF